MIINNFNPSRIAGINPNTKQVSNMQHRRLGKTGFKVSEIGLGCWQLGNDFGEIAESQAQQILDTALDAGINFFDTADVYGAGLSERRIGQFRAPLKQAPIIATKVGRDAALYPNGYSKQTIKHSLEKSLQRLGVDSIDLAQLHCIPREVLFDGEVFTWMQELVSEGLIKNYGASVEMIDEARFCCQQPELATLQILFNVFRQDAIQTLLPLAAKNDIGIIVRLPLASGLLSGKLIQNQQFEQGDHRNYNADGAAFHVGETFNGIPYNKGVELVDTLKTTLKPEQSMLEVALRWILDQPQVSTVIAGASKSAQVLSNAKASTLPALSNEQHHQLSQFYQEQVREHIRGGI